MNKYPMKLDIKRDLQRLRILAHPVNANKNVAFDEAGDIGIVKRDNVSVTVMLQVGAIHLKEILIGTEDVIEMDKLSVFPRDNLFKP